MPAIKTQQPVHFDARDYLAAHGGIKKCERTWWFQLYQGDRLMRTIPVHGQPSAAKNAAKALARALGAQTVRLCA